MKKFNRQYLLAIQYGETRYKEKEKLDNGNEIEVTKYKEGNNELVIRPFFTIRFNIDRGIYSSMNTFSIDILNLAKDTREKIYYDGILHAAVKKRIIMYAGYNETYDLKNFQTSTPVISDNIKQSINGVPLIFNGRITRAYSYRQGTDFITHIEAFDLPEKNEVKIDTEFDKGFDKESLREKLSQELNIDKENVIISKSFNFEPFKEKKSFGKISVWEFTKRIVESANYKIRKEQGENVPLFKLYYDYPYVRIQKDDEYDEREFVLINSDTGLLSTPIRENAKITFKCLFEPTFRCGGAVRLDSRTTQTGISGILKVVGFKHSGTISPAISENLTTDFTCFLGIDQLEAEK